MEETPLDIQFERYILMLGSQAMVHTGKAKNPLTGTDDVNERLAALELGILTLLKEKTRNNITAEETALLEKTILAVETAYRDLKEHTNA